MPKFSDMAYGVAEEHEVLSQRERNKQRTRRALESSALDLFATKGFDCTTIEDICERAAVSPRTFFRYFAGKEAVIVEQWTDRPDTYRAAVLSRPAGEPLLVALREAYVDFVSREEDGARRRMFLRNRVIHLTPSLRGLVEDRVGANWRAAVADAIAVRLGAPGPGPDHELMADVVMTIIGQATAAWVMRGENVPPEDLGRQEFDRYTVALRLLLADS